VANQIRRHAATMLGVQLCGAAASDGRSGVETEETGVKLEDISLHDSEVWFPDGRSIALERVALSSLHQQDQHQIMATASHKSYDSPPPFGAQFVEVAVDTETGQVTVERVLMVADIGRVINPITASGQVEGGIAQGLGFALCEEMVYDEDGHLINPRLGPYHVYKADEMPEIEVMFVETDEPTGPFGAKSVAELAIDGIAPAVADAIHDATGVWLREVPFTPERVWRELRRIE
jgi:putative selenate reductase molybdopterin-binding subunit